MFSTAFTDGADPISCLISLFKDGIPAAAIVVVVVVGTIAGVVVVGVVGVVGAVTVVVGSGVVATSGRNSFVLTFRTYEI